MKQPSKIDLILQHPSMPIMCMAYFIFSYYKKGELDLIGVTGMLVCFFWLLYSVIFYSVKVWGNKNSTQKFYKNDIDDRLATTDENFFKVANLFAAANKSATFSSELLDASKFDFSIESLKHVDSYLHQMNMKKPTGKDLHKVVMCAGAYLGEVMKRQASTNTHWYNHDEAAKNYSPLTLAKPSMATIGVLSNGESHLFPYAVVCEVLDGKSHASVFKYATTMRGIL